MNIQPIEASSNPKFEPVDSPPIIGLATTAEGKPNTFESTNGATRQWDNTKS